MSIFEAEKRLHESLGKDGFKRVGELEKFGFRRYDTEETKALRIVQLLKFCTNLVKIHGFDQPFSLDFAAKSEIGTAVAFRAQDDKNRVVYGIRLGAKVLEDPDLPHFEQASIYGGFTLHEAEHLLSSGEFYSWLEKFKKKGFKDMKHAQDLLPLLRIMEDVRIERIAAQKSPGFAPYLGSTREYVFGEDARKIAKEWDDIPNTSKFLSVLTFALRCPDHLSKAMKEWSIFGHSPFELVQRIPDRLDTFKDVLWCCEEILKVLSAIEALERSLMGSAGESSEKGASGGAGKEGSSGEGSSDEASKEAPKELTKEEVEALKEALRDVLERLSKGLGKDLSPDAGKDDFEFDPDDKAAEDFRKSELETLLESLKATEAKASGTSVGTLRAEKISRTSMGSGAGAEDDPSGWEENETAVSKELGAIRRILDGIEKVSRSRRGFTLADVELLGRETDDVTEGVDGTTMGKVESLIDEHFDEVSASAEDTFKSAYRPGISVAMKEPRQDPTAVARYKEIRRLVSPHIGATRSVFRFRMGEQAMRETERKQGKLWRKRLGTAPLNDRIFYRSSTKKTLGISICLLLDESGSMGDVEMSELRLGMKDPQRLRGALAVAPMAVMLAEGLKSIPKADLHIYSHESYNGETDCLVKKWYGKGREGDMALGNYAKTCGNENYDHRAIECTHERFSREAIYPKKVMIVLADGVPLGSGYGGVPARNAVRRVSDKILKSGTFILSVGVSGHDPADMFKHKICFKGDFRGLLAEMRKIFKTQVFDSGFEFT